MALAVHTTGGELKIAGVSMHTAAWRVRDITPLMFDSPLRGEYVTIPGVDGESIVPKRQASAQWSLPFVIIGACDLTGTPYSNKWEGLMSNVNYLRTYCLTGRGSSNPNRHVAATLTVPGEGAPRTADIHCWITPGDSIGNAQMLATLEIHIPTGMFV